MTFQAGESMGTDQPLLTASTGDLGFSLSTIKPHFNIEQKTEDSDELGMNEAASVPGCTEQMRAWCNRI